MADGNHEFEALNDYLAREPFGLSPSETRMLWWCLQGGGYRPDHVADDMPRFLAAEVASTRDTFLQIQRDFGGDPCDAGAPADRAFEYNDLIERLMALPQADARHLYFFMSGYLAGACDGTLQGAR